MYPSVNALDDYAVGFKKYYKPTVDEIMNDSFIGIVKCEVIPPKNLYLPVLPERVKGPNGVEKLMFHLNPMTGVWARLKGLMKPYVERFLKMKTCNAGVKTAEECQQLNEAHRQLGLNIVIQPEETCKNPGMKEISKLCLNSLWGKFGQRPDLDSYQLK